MPPKRRRPPDKAYRNRRFLSSGEARSLRVLSEYLEPASRFAHYEIEDTIVFMGSARIISREQAEAELAAARKRRSGIKQARQRLATSRYYEDARELADRLTAWSKGLNDDEHRFVICTGGGPGIMEGANRGASEARGKNIGMSISIPQEQSHNRYITRELSFNFHYFFMRKFWFAYLAKAMIFFPGGYGTLDELFEVLTLLKTGKIRKRLPVVLFGREYWRDVIDFDALVRHGTIDPQDQDLFLVTDSVDETFTYITEQLTEYSLREKGPSL